MEKFHVLGRVRKENRRNFQEEILKHFEWKEY